MYPADTIAAISTPFGEGAIGIIRLSGPDSLSILKLLFRRKQDGGYSSHRFYYGEIIAPPTCQVVDECLAVFMKSPRSFTREDLVEIHCHGGTLVVEKVLDLVLGAGARLAAPGEFTKRAFLNGRIDLLQAESVMDIIRGKTDSSLALAQHQREGVLSSRLEDLRSCLRKALALIEAFMDFPEEDLGADDSIQLARDTDRAASITNALIDSYGEGKVLRDGVAVVIAGKPNVGKSSLLNTLLREKRAIVTALPGTTRDVIEEVVNLHGLPVRLLDTAGIRTSNDPIEQEGVRRATERIPGADLVLFMLDRSRPYDVEDRAVAEVLSGASLILVRNKADLSETLQIPSELGCWPVIDISTATGEGVVDLTKMIAEIFLHGHAVDSREYVALSRARHRDSLLKVQQALTAFQDHLQQGFPGEILALDLRSALDAVGEVTGETTPDHILDLIFSQFCIGK